MSVKRKPRQLIAGNWKMNGTNRDLTQLAQLARMVGKTKPTAELLICPPATLLQRAKSKLTGQKIRLGGQDCHAQVQGAQTGDVSAEMLKEAGASAVIVGHSERRRDYLETDKQVQAKGMAAHRARLTAIICIGETLKERKSGDTLKVVGRQLRASMPQTATAKNTVIAYEPVWAIGTGLTPTPEQVAEVHAHIRKILVKKYGTAGQGMRILYGGSVSPANAAELLAIENVNGALVGGASLKADDFIQIIKAAS